MHSDDMNKIEVRNVEKYPLFAVFYGVFFSMGNHSMFLFVVVVESKLDIICNIEHKIDFIRRNFFVFFVVFFEILKVNY